MNLRNCNNSCRVSVSLIHLPMILLLQTTVSYCCSKLSLLKEIFLLHVLSTSEGTFLFRTSFHHTYQCIRWTFFPTLSTWPWRPLFLTLVCQEFLACPKVDSFCRFRVVKTLSFLSDRAHKGGWFSWNCGELACNNQALCQFHRPFLWSCSSLGMTHCIQGSISRLLGQPEWASNSHIGSLARILARPVHKYCSLLRCHASISR